MACCPDVEDAVSFHLMCCISVIALSQEQVHELSCQRLCAPASLSAEMAKLMQDALLCMVISLHVGCKMASFVIVHTHLLSFAQCTRGDVRMQTAWTRLAKRAREHFTSGLMRRLTMPWARALIRLLCSRRTTMSKPLAILTCLPAGESHSCDFSQSFLPYGVTHVHCNPP